MRQKLETSLCSVRDLDVHRLHVLLRDVFSLGQDLESDAERARERAFNVQSNGALFKWHYLHAQVGKRFQEGSVSSAERQRAAIQKFLEYELACRETNGRIHDAFTRPSAAKFDRLLRRARVVMCDLLGEFDVDQLPICSSFSSGASTEFRRSNAAPQHKWALAAHITKSALPYAVAFQRWAGRTWPLTVVPGNKVFTVVKNYRSDRTCAKEPSWNMFFQKGVGELIRRRLQRKAGLLHSDAQQQHGRMAQEASVTGREATLDLQGASDCVTLALVELLCPPSWSKVFVDLRSHCGELPNGDLIPFEKISSMGNGYTFELETALFYSLVVAVCGTEKVSVYGDDIICPSQYARSVEQLLAFVGFSLNKEKSFSSGPFRESCGGHYWRGRDVKPFYIERLPTTFGSVINLHNDIVRWLDGGPKYHRFIEILRECRRLIPRSFWGPYGTAGCLWAEWDEARPRYVRGATRPFKSGFKVGARSEHPVAYHHWRIKTIRREVVKQRHDYLSGSLLYTLSQGRGFVVRDRRYHDLRELALSLRKQEEVELSNLQFVTTREIIGWAAVDVKQRWPSLPVRISLDG